LRGWHASKAANGAPLKRAQTEAKKQSQMLNHNYKNTHTPMQQLPPQHSSNQLKLALGHLRSLPKDSNFNNHWQRYIQTVT